MQLRQLQDFLRGQRAGALRTQLQEMRSAAARGVHGVHGDMVRDRCARNYTANMPTCYAYYCILFMLNEIDVPSLGKHGHFLMFERV